MRRGSAFTRPALVAGAAGSGAVLGAGAGSVAAAAYFARKVVTPDDLQPDDVEVLQVGTDTVTFRRGPDPDVHGRYGLWLDGGEGHARVGGIIGHTKQTVTRRLISVDRGELLPGTARWNQYYWWDRPSVAMGLQDEDATVVSELGPLPGWVVRPDPARDRGHWAVLVHGRGARKEETLRAVPTLRHAGYTCLVTAYRNDRDAPRGPDGRYNLGLSEWRDVEAAMAYAVANGADRLLLGGWSMGGAIVMQTLARTPLSTLVTGVLLNSAVLDWRAVLRHQARLNRIPSALATMTERLLAGERGSRHLVGMGSPLDITATDWVARSDELHLPMLVVHSDGDTVVPIGPALALAERRPDIVRLERYGAARHCREWNLDPHRWESALYDFTRSLAGRAEQPPTEQAALAVQEGQR